ncbi:MAG: MFS transporter [Oscillospiraceae bacterium]|nr:MFS transporter [Oscillospiraceae bacterium]
MGKEKVSPLAASENSVKKYLSGKEWVIYLVAVFFYTNMTGMIAEYRKAYLVDIMMLDENRMAFFNSFTSIAGFALSFVYAMILDNRKPKNGQKFKRLGILAAIPCGLVTFLIFYAPSFIANNPNIFLAYIIILAVVQGLVFYFGNTVNLVAMVMSPNAKEREKLISFRQISSSVGNSAPLVIVMVMGVIVKAINHGESNTALNYLLSAGLCSVIGTITMLLGMSVVKERITYKQEAKKNPLMGFADVLKNKHARIVLYSEFLKSFRGIATFMQPFIAAAMLGSSSKTLFFALPVGIGTMCGMLIVNFLLKRLSARVIYIGSGIYSVLANLIAFGVGYLKLTREDMSWLQIPFIICLWLVGLQFGASNLLPHQFQADILDDLELKTQKRLDGSLPFVLTIGSTLSATIASTVAPYILYGDKSIIHYVQGLEDGTQQGLKTKILLLFFYTVVHGIMMFLAGVPFFFYKLTGKEKDRVHEEVLAQRAMIAAQNGETTEVNNG